jgi:hypothetical protein
VALTVMQIDRHIEVLERFEQRYGEYLVARHNRVGEGRSDWSSREWAERERELRMLAPRADAAMVASGLDPWADLPGMILNFEGWTGFSSFATEDKLQREILAQIPSQIEGLRMRREEAEEASRQKGRWLRKAFARPRSRWRWLHDPNPWALTIIGAVVAGLVVLAVWAAITG